MIVFRSYYTLLFRMNSNKRLMLNTAILNVRMVIMAICSFLSTRFALSALGIDDFGIFSLVASIVTFISLINSLMLSTSYRYITVSIGKGNELEANKTFNVCLTIHVFIALFSILLLLPLGEWYIYSYINYVGDIHNVITVYRLVVIASFISFIGVPYMGLLTAKENFLVLCGFDILCSFLKLAASILIMYIEQYRLVIYAVVIALTTAFPAFTYYLYCTFRYSTISKWNIVKDPKLYIEMAKFSGWVGYGAIACIGKDQGGQLIVNAFLTLL